MRLAAPKWKDDSDGKGSEVDFWHFRLAVHRHIDYKPTDWLMSVFGLGIEKVLLVNAKTLAEAKKAAKRYLFDYLTKAAHEVGRLKES